MAQVQLFKGLFHKVVEPAKIKAHLGKPALKPPQPRYVRALAAALFALDRAGKKGAPAPPGVGK